MSDDWVSGWKPWPPGGTWQQGFQPSPSGYDYSLAKVTPSDTGTTVPFSAAFADRIKRLGDVMKGPLTLAAPSSGDMDAVSKSYVDAVATGTQNFSSSVLFLVGGTMTGFLTLNADPQQPLEAATKQYVDTRDAAVLATATAQANSAAAPAAAAAAVAQATANAALPLIGGTLTGTLTLAADPVFPLGAVTKQYVDLQIATIPIATGTDPLASLAFGDIV